MNHESWCLIIEREEATARSVTATQHPARSPHSYLKLQYKFPSRAIPLHPLTHTWNFSTNFRRFLFSLNTFLGWRHVALIFKKWLSCNAISSCLDLEVINSGSINLRRFWQFPLFSSEPIHIPSVQRNWFSHVLCMLVWSCTIPARYQ